MSRAILKLKHSSATFKLAALIPVAMVTVIFCSVLSTTTTFLQHDLPKYSEAAELSELLPDILIIGAENSGATSLAYFLGFHPLIRAIEQPLDFFSADENFELGLEFYLSLLPIPTNPYEIMLEASSSYFSAISAARIRATYGNRPVKLILVLTNPVERLINNCVELLENPMNEPVFSELVFGNSSELPVVNDQLEIIRFGYYAMNLKGYLDAGFEIGKHIHIVNGDNFIKNPGKEILGLEKFLRIQPVINESSFDFDNENGFYCLSLPNLTLKSEKTKENRYGCPSSSVGLARPKLTLAQRKALVYFYTPMNRELFQIIGYEFPDWNCYGHDGNKDCI